MQKTSNAHKRFIIIGVSVFIIAAIALIGYYAFSIAGKSNSKPGEITNTSERHDQANGGGAPANGTDAKPDESTNAAQDSAASGLIDKNIAAIQSRLDAAITDIWFAETGDALFKELEDKYSITHDDSKWTVRGGGPLFGAADAELQLVAGWQVSGFKCNLSGDEYTCSMQGDWAKLPSGPPSEWNDQLNTIHQFLATQVHGPNGSERDMQTITVKIIMSPDHNGGEIVLVGGDDIAI